MSVKWGVIGAGGIADRRTIPEGLISAKNAELVAVMDIDEGRVRQVAEKYGGLRYYTREEDLLEDKQIEAVYIATPTYLHHQQTLMAARARKHILCEKPMAMNLKDAEKMIAVCQENKVKLSLGYMMRYHTYNRKIKEMIDGGKLGNLVMGRAQLTCWYPPIEGAWRQNPSLGAGGSLIDMGSHCIDLLEWMMGPVREVFCFTSRLVHNYPVEDTATVLLRFKSGAQALVDSHFNVPDASSENRLEIYGTKGSILARGTIGQDSTGEMVAKIEEQKGYQAGQKREEVREESIVLEAKNIYQAEIEDFSNCILQGENAQPSFTGEDGLRNLKIVLAAYESARKGRTVEIR